MAVIASRVTRLAAVKSLLVSALCAGLLVGCATPGRPPIADRSPVFAARPATYVVRPGDTLYSIAWRYELDFAGLARANGLRAPYIIYAGQQLRLRVQLPRAGRSASIPEAVPPSAPVPVRTWQWPVSGPIVRDYGATNKGVNFQLRAGAQVHAAAAGEVVYAGNGLGGHAHLVIIKHSDRYLSAYSLNAVGSVREGQRVEAGANLVRFPNEGTAESTLHFEIREHGNAINPRTLIGR